jgi:DNA helicase IV
VVEILTQRYADTLGADPLGGGTLFTRRDLEDIKEDLAGEPAVQRLVDRLWPRLTPERLLADLYASPERIAAATKGWSDIDRKLLFRPAGSEWTPADVPLLEEADELLGTDPTVRGAQDVERQRALRQAQETLDVLAGSRSIDAEADAEAVLSAGDLLDAEALAARQVVADTRTAAQRAAEDRTWTFGHVVVDEAQELSAMAWRTVLRKCPTRSMTVVGDVAQTGSSAGASSWGEMLRPHLGETWRQEQLTINYRTPAEIMEVAADVLAVSGAATAAPRSVRSTGERPWAMRVDEPQLPARAAEAAAEMADDGGTLAVIVPPSRLEAVAERLPGTSGAAADLTAGPVVLTPTEAKGLEFDAVLVVDPAGIVEEGVRGLNDLYVALTRATRSLGVVHPGELPAHLGKLISR